MTKDIYPLYFGAASKNIDNVMESSSGGIFFELSSEILHAGGVVYGASQESPLSVCHTRAETVEGIKKFRKSKYLRSSIGNCYRQVKEDLDAGRIVLFSGVGCQIAGLYRYLPKEYANLYTCEVVCHGLPIREVLQKYISENEQNNATRLVTINFRDKREGWRKNCINERYENGSENINLSEVHPVHHLYLKGINMERGCGKCTYQKLPRRADITLADFWKYPEGIFDAYENKGISLVVLNNTGGKELFEKIKGEILWTAVSKDAATNSCRHMDNAPYEHPSRRAFEKLISDYSFKTLYPLFEEFGEVILPDQLVIFTEVSFDKVIDTFIHDTNEIVYFVDKGNSLQGITTFGEFISACNSGREWINRTNKRVRLEIGCEKEIRKIFQENKKINRIPVIDENNRILFEVRRYCNTKGQRDKRKLLLTNVLLEHRQIDHIYAHRPDFKPNFVYTLRQQVRIHDKISFPVILSNPDGYRKEANDLFQGKYSKEYIEMLGQIPPIIKIGGRYVHADASSDLVNVIGGKRITTGNPDHFSYSIHIYGRCGVFGYAVEDGDTLPSALQELLINSNHDVRVVNHGLWGADDGKIISNLWADLRRGEIKKNDIVIFYLNLPLECNEWKQVSVPVINTTDAFHSKLKDGCNFYDQPGHMTDKGYKLVAQLIFDELAENDHLDKEGEIHPNSSVAKANYKEFHEMEDELVNFIDSTKKLLPSEIERSEDSIGAIVMNCNPFTFGHRYLIEKARQEVDRLIIFVVEEDKSFFPYKQRYEMVRKGTEDLKEVYVLPSGKFMISALTFPEYFTKEKNKDIIISPTADIVLFGEYIAPAFHIAKRFVGTEPDDPVTAQYNKLMKELFPKYGIELKEIERLKNGNHYITATAVRDHIKHMDHHVLRELLPASTLSILRSSNMLGER